MNIAIITGSPRKGSVTHRLALFLKNQLIEKTTHDINLIDVRDWNLPLLQDVFATIEKSPEEF